MEENGTTPSLDPEERWHFGPNKHVMAVGSRSMRRTMMKIMASVEETGPRPVIPLGHSDPSKYPSFRTPQTAEDAIVEALRSAQYNSYGSSTGVLPARLAVAEYLSRDLPYKLSPDDVFLTVGCTQAIEVVITALARPGANILLPRPGYPMYESRCIFSHLEMRHFDLVPEKGWEVDIGQVEELADDNTVAIVLINPNNPCGSVLKYQHMEEIAKTANKLGILVICDEVYGHMTFGNNPFVPMGVFGDIVPVITLGSITKRWIVPGWRLGWIVTADPKHILRKTQVVDSIRSYLNITCDPVTFIQGAIPQIIEKTKDDFFNNIINLLRYTGETFYNEIKNVKCLTCPHKPEASVFVLLKLNLSYLENISDNIDFCTKLAKEESVIATPGSVMEMKNWLRMTFVVEPTILEVALERRKSFCRRHEKN